MHPLAPEPYVLDLEQVDIPTLLTMFSIGGVLLHEVVSDAPTLPILTKLCESLRSVVGADEATLCVVDPVDLGSLAWIQVDSHGVSIERDSTRDVPSTHRVEIRSGSGDPLGEVGCSWDDPKAHPTNTEAWIVWQAGLLATLIAERHVNVQRQLEVVALEREDLAGQIHDDPIQILTAMSLRLQRLITRLTDDADREAAQELQALATVAIDRLRHLMFSLNPPMLDEDGLAASLGDYCENYVETEGIAWEILDGLTADIPFEISSMAFRLTRDAIFNVVKHAHASKLTIDASRDKTWLQIAVRDDGVGFDVATYDTSRPGHIGIAHARTLAAHAGGTYSITSGPDHGTEVRIDLPAW